MGGVCSVHMTSQVSFPDSYLHEEPGNEITVHITHYVCMRNVCVCTCVYVCVCACVHVCMCACVHVCKL